VIYSVQTKLKDVEYYMKKCIKLSGRIYEKMSEKIGEKHETFKERHLFLRQRINRRAVRFYNIGLISLHKLALLPHANSTKSIRRLQ